jgi:hypothetical protein
MQLNAFGVITSHMSSLNGGTKASWLHLGGGGRGGVKLIFEHMGAHSKGINHFHKCIFYLN